MGEQVPRTALVTGGNRGLGFEAARQLMARGARVILTSRDLARGEDAAGQLRASSSCGDVEVVALDVTDSEQVRALPETLGEVELDALINNAGISLNGFDANVAERTLAANFHGPLEITDALIDSLSVDARVVMVSSGLGSLDCLGPELRAEFDAPGLDRDQLLALVERFLSDVRQGSHTKAGWPSSAYRVSKVALNALTRVLARELPRELCINAVCPGWVQTDMGGAGATLPVEQGADTIVWAACLGPGGPRGEFLRERSVVSW